MLGPRQRTPTRPPSALCQVDKFVSTCYATMMIDQTFHRPRSRRRRSYLATDEMAAGDRRAFDVTRPAVSHIRRLRAAGLVSCGATGRVVPARPAGLEPLRTCSAGSGTTTERLRVAAEARWRTTDRTHAEPRGRRTRRRDVIERDVRIAARRPSSTFWTDPQRSFCGWADRDASTPVRGWIRIDYGSGHVMLGEVVELDPPGAPALTWAGRTPPRPRPARGAGGRPDGRRRRTRFRLAPPGRRTAADSHAEGWDYFLGRLAAAAPDARPDTSRLRRARRRPRFRGSSRGSGGAYHRGVRERRADRFAEPARTVRPADAPFSGQRRCHDQSTRRPDRVRRPGPR